MLPGVAEYLRQLSLKRAPECENLGLRRQHCESRADLPMEDKRGSSQNLAASPEVGRSTQADLDAQFLCQQALEIRARSRGTHSGEGPLAMVGQIGAALRRAD
jgi:hypothetical protein